MVSFSQLPAVKPPTIFGASQTNIGPSYFVKELYALGREVISSAFYKKYATNNYLCHIVYKKTNQILVKSSCISFFSYLYIEPNFYIRNTILSQKTPKNSWRASMHWHKITLHYKVCSDSPLSMPDPMDSLIFETPHFAKWIRLTSILFDPESTKKNTG